MYSATHQAGIWSRQFPTPCGAGERGRRFGVCYPLRCSGSPLSGSESGSRSANCSPSLYWPLKRGLRGAGSLMRRACAPVCIIRNRTSAAAYNALLDEVDAQHEALEQKVRERTAELDIARQQAQDANELKSRFLAHM